MYVHFFKRLMDFTIVLIALLIIWPVLLIIALWLYFANEGAGVFFTQERIGKQGRCFRIVKFKTMNDRKDSNGKLLPDAERLTNAGKFVRSTSIDELPQLLNVLKGDMALIGPRPLLPRYLPYYTETESHRHDVRPGITGWAQCHGRNSLTWDDKLAMDVWYVNNISFIVDLKILYKTIVCVFKRESVEVSGVEALDTYRNRQKCSNFKK